MNIKDVITDCCIEIIEIVKIFCSNNHAAIDDVSGAIDTINNALISRDVDLLNWISAKKDQAIREYQRGNEAKMLEIKLLNEFREKVMENG